MLNRGRALKVIIHLNEDSISTENFIYQQVFQFLYDHQIAGATLSRLEEGFGSHHQRHDREGHGESRRHLPVRIEFIDSREHVEAILPELCDLVSDGLVEMQETTIIKAAKQEGSV
jgi:uncharacterized protein